MLYYIRVPSEFKRKTYVKAFPYKHKGNFPPHLYRTEMASKLEKTHLNE